MNRDPDFLRAEALAPTEGLALPVDAAPPPSTGSVASCMVAEVAVLLGFSDGGAPALVLRTGESAAIAALALLPLRSEHIGRRVALLPLRGADEVDWLVIGLLAGQAAWPAEPPMPDAVSELLFDGRRLALLARDELALRCGKAAVTLRADGRVEIRGETIVSQAVRANRVRGGSVELN